MRLFGQQSGTWIRLDETFLLGSGGEGHVYSVLNDSAFAAKLFHEEHRKERADKLRAMLDNPPVPPGGKGHTSIAWPCDLLSWEPGGPVAGYLMPRVRHARVIDDFYNPPTRLEHCPLFHYEYLLCTARNLAAAVRSLHKRGYVIGDIKQANILVTPNSLVTLVDTDSFQVREEASGKVYRCPVGTPEYTPPELQEQTPSGALEPQHDLFGLAVLIFQLLMEGSHPFAGVYALDEDPPPLGERIRLGHFPYRAGKRLSSSEEMRTFMRQQAHFAPGARIIPCSPSRKALSFEVVPPEIRALLLQCFEDGYSNPKARPEAQAWLDALDKARASLIVCGTNSQHRYGQHLSRCPWCERMHTQLHGRDPFPSKEAVEARPPVPSPDFAPLSAQAPTSMQALGARKFVSPAPTSASGPAAPRQNYAWAPAILVGAFFSVLGFCSILQSSSNYSTGREDTVPRHFVTYQQTPLRPAPTWSSVNSESNSIGIYSAALSSDGKTAAISSDRVRIKNTETGSTLMIFPHSSGDGFIRSLRFSPDASQLVMSDSLGSALLWKKGWHACLPLLTSSSGPARILDFLKDGKHLALGAKNEENDNLVMLFNTTTGEIEKTYKGDYGERIACGQFSPDGKKLVVTTSDGARAGLSGWKMYCWDVATGKPLWTRSDIPLGSSLAVSPDGSEIAIGGDEVELRRMEDGEKIDFGLVRGDVLGFSSEGSWLAVNMRTHVMLLQRQPPFRTVKVSVAHVLSAVFANDNCFITLSSTEGVEAWDAETGEKLHQMPISLLSN